MSYHSMNILTIDNSTTEIEKKNVKSTLLEVEKPLEMGPDLQKFQKKKKKVKSAVFEEEKSLDMSRGFRPWAAHSRQKII